MEETEAVKLTEKGSRTISDVSQMRCESLITKPFQLVHERCRVTHIHPHYIKREILKRKSCESTADNEVTPSKLRSNHKFNFQNDCLFCGQHVVKQGSREKWYFVQTLEVQSTILDICHKRNDEWGREVQGRIASVVDLHAADAVYHKVCSSNFRTSRGVQDSNTTSTVGRPTSQATFLKIIKYLEEECDNAKQITVSDLVSKMQEICGNENAYTSVWMKKKLNEHYGDEIVLTENQGKASVITFRKTASSILHRFYKDGINNQSEEEEKMKIIKTAAELIRHDVCALERDKEIYPNALDISDLSGNLDVLPRSLQLLMKVIINDKKSNLKVASIWTGNHSNYEAKKYDMPITAWARGADASPVWIPLSR